MLIFARVYCKLSIWSSLNFWLNFLMKLCEHNLSQTVPFQYLHLFQRTSQIHGFVISNSISTTAASWLKSHKFSTWKLHSSCILNPLSVFGCLTVVEIWWFLFYDFCHLAGWFSNGFTFLYELEFGLSS